MLIGGISVKTFSITSLVFIGALLLPQLGFSMSKGPINYVQSTGKSQAQFSVATERDGLLLLRGHAAEVLYKNIRVKQEAGKDAALQARLGAKLSDSYASGSVVTCHEIKSASKSEYACSLEFRNGVNPVAYRDTFSAPGFNWAENYGGTNLVKGSAIGAGSRGIASVSGGPRGSGGAKVYFLTPKDRTKKTDNVLVLVNGKAADRLYNMMADSKDSKAFRKGNGAGFRGDGIACVHGETGKKEDAYRCSFTVSLSNGDIVKSYNPLFAEK